MSPFLLAFSLTLSSDWTARCSWRFSCKQLNLVKGRFVEGGGRFITQLSCWFLVPLLQVNISHFHDVEDEEGVASKELDQDGKWSVCRPEGWVSADFWARIVDSSCGRRSTLWGRSCRRAWAILSICWSLQSSSTIAVITYSHAFKFNWLSSTPFDPWPKNH